MLPVLSARRIFLLRRTGPGSATALRGRSIAPWPIWSASYVMLPLADRLMEGLCQN